MATTVAGVKPTRKKSLKLRSVKHDMPDTLWCGPAVLSSITGRKTSVITNMIKVRRYGRKRKTPAIKSTGSGDLAEVLNACGYKLVCTWHIMPGAPPTLAAWLKGRLPHQRNRLYILEVTGHWIAVKGRKFVDSHTRAPVWLKDIPHRRSRVHRVWEVVAMRLISSRPQQKLAA